MNRLEYDNHYQSEKDYGCASPINCQRLANIIGGEVITATPVCVVQRLRDIKATILGRTTRSPLALPFALSFEKNIERLNSSYFFLNSHERT